LDKARIAGPKGKGGEGGGYSNFKIGPSATCTRPILKFERLPHLSPKRKGGIFCPEKINHPHGSSNGLPLKLNLSELVPFQRPLVVKKIPDRAKKALRKTPTETSPVHSVTGTSK